MKLPTVLKHHLCIFVINSLPISFCYLENNKRSNLGKKGIFPPNSCKKGKGTSFKESNENVNSNSEKFEKIFMHPR